MMLFLRAVESLLKVTPRKEELLLRSQPRLCRRLQKRARRHRRARL